MSDRMQNPTFLSTGHMSDQSLNLKFWLVTRQAKTVSGLRPAILFATVFLAVVALCGIRAEAATY